MHAFFSSRWLKHLLTVTALTAVSAEARPQWTLEQAQAWQQQHGWLVGCNFMPSNAINQLEMFQAETFDEATIDRELGYAESLGFNSIRLFMHDLLWQQDQAGYIKRVEKVLELAEKRHIGVLMVLFDSCWHPIPALGQQPAPLPHRHNSGWVQSPGAKGLTDPAELPRLQEYVTSFIKHFAQDKRIHGWDVWNEPDNFDGGEPIRPGLDPTDKLKLVDQMIPQVFEWARAADPSQPLTSGVWTGPKWNDKDKLNPTQVIQLEQSDVISFHSYGKAEDVKTRIQELKSYERPILCTEYMARPQGSTFDPILGLLKEAGIAAYNWGFVNGKTQTIYPWDSWKKDYTAPPELWFHDIFNTDGTPYRQAEVDHIRQVTGVDAKTNDLKP